MSVILKISGENYAEATFAAFCYISQRLQNMLLRLLLAS